jgi:endoglucanase
LVKEALSSEPGFNTAMSWISSKRDIDPHSQFFVAKPNPGAIEQIADLISEGNSADADLIKEMIEIPQAVWLAGGKPESVEQKVKEIVQVAYDKGAVPILVAYNIPGRDCSQYSSGGADTGAGYKAWIDAFAAGLGDYIAVVILEPDSLALTPTDCGLPDTYDRVGLINYAAHALSRDLNASIYLDAGNSAWHSVGDMASRLVAGGVKDVQGFFLNVSNYQTTEHEVKYGTWISKCIAFANNPEQEGWRLDRYDLCASQYYPADPNDFSTWHLTDEWYDANLGNAIPTVHFIIDTSRNGQGPWTPPADHPEGDLQSWCNPPDRGLGYRPTANTGQALVDAYLWVKIPGESDGECHRWTSGPHDPVCGIRNPPAGHWFPDMALELVRNAKPPLG